MATTEQVGIHNPVARIPKHARNARNRRANAAFSLPGGGVSAARNLYRSKFTEVTNTNYTIESPDHTLLVTTGNTDRTVTLPLAADYKGRAIIIKKVDTGTGLIVVDGNGSETIDDSNTRNIVNAYSAVEVLSTGTEWVVVDEQNIKSSGYASTVAFINTNYDVVQPVQTIFILPGGSDRTVTLPTAASYYGVTVTVKKVAAGAGNVLVDANGSETIDGTTTVVTLANTWDSVSVASDGTQWFKIAQFP